MLTYLFNFFKKKNTIAQVNNITINSLAPKILTDENDIEKIRPYLNSIKKTLDAKGITNIALTGGYGSGKSTIIKTFQNLYEKEFEYLNISLASFKDIDEEKKSTKNKKNL